MELGVTTPAFRTSAPCRALQQRELCAHRLLEPSVRRPVLRSSFLTQFEMVCRPTLNRRATAFLLSLEWINSMIFCETQADRPWAA